ncbi:MAG: beta-propeller fold lactonase family protein [Deltaproteobacteria bacterium]|nr:beta-propeller fold lactonase family protein [Deltaproteobacteria bacterium]
MRTQVVWILPLWLLVAACGDDDGPAAGGDSGARDAGDLGAPDASAPDGSSIDGGNRADAAGDDGAALDATPPPPEDAGPPPARDRLVYVTVGREDRIAVVVLGADGSLTARDDLGLSLPSNPGPMTYARATRRLYVGLGGSLATLALEADGRPTLLGETGGLDGQPVYVATARDDALVVTAYFGGDELRVHDVSGMPPHAETDREDTSDEPHAALVGPGGRVYVPHRNGNTTWWLDLSSAGVITMAGSLAGEDGVGPRHIAFTPDGTLAFVVNEYADSVSAHRVGADGSLTRFQTITTLPAGFDGDSNTCADVHTTPDGRFVYASNRGHDSIAMFAIGADGTLASLGTVPTEARPREIDVSPDGRFVVACGQDSGFLQSYRVEPDGRLASVARLRVGDELLWAIID